MDLTSRGRCHEADKRDKNAQPVGPMNKQTNEKKLIERILGNKTEEVKMGLDVHARDVVMCVQEDNSLAQRPQRTSGAQVVTLVHGLAKAGCKVYVSQEAGPCGFGLHRELATATSLSRAPLPTVANKKPTASMRWRLTMRSTATNAATPKRSARCGCPRLKKSSTATSRATETSSR